MALPASDPHALAIADRVVPAYRTRNRSYSCAGHVAKAWQAAYDGACQGLAARGAAQ